MAKSIKSIKHPAFLAKNIILLIITGCLTFYILFAVRPSNPLIVGVFLLALFAFLTFLLSTIWFFVRFRGQKRVWYLKDEAFSVIYRKSLFISLYLCLLLFLQSRFVGQLNWLTFSVLTAFILIGYIVTVRAEKKQDPQNSNPQQGGIKSIRQQ